MRLLCHTGNTSTARKYESSVLDVRSQNSGYGKEEHGKNKKQQCKHRKRDKDQSLENKIG